MKNAQLAYILTFLSECYWPSVAALFFYLRYFSFAEIATLWAIQLAVSNLMEIPTGAFADMAGRRVTIILSFAIGGLGLLVFPFTTAFWVFVILEVIKGLSNALYSGSMEALVYDSLKGEGRERSYTRIVSNIETITWAGWAISAVGGGYLYYWQYQSPWLIQAGMFAVAAICCLKLIEPKIDSIKINLKSALQQNIEGFRELFITTRVTKITLRLVVVGAGFFIAANILGASQLREYGFDARGTGWIFGIGCIISVIASRYFPNLLRLFGEKKLIIITALVLLFSFLGAKYVGIVAGSALIIMRIASSSTFRNTRSVIVNKWISSKNRATSLSTLNLLTQAPYVLLAPLLGATIDRTSPNQFAWWLGVGIVLLVGGMRVLYSRRG